MRTDAAGNRLTGWVMMALVIAVLTIAVYSASSDRGDPTVAVPTTKPLVEHMPNEVRVLLSFVDGITFHGGVATGHDVTATGVRYVAAALGTVASSAGLDIDPELEAIREHARRIERDPRPLVRTAEARMAFHTLATLLDAMQRARFRGLEPDVANVGRAASSLRGGHRLSDQSDVVQEFFDRAASVIRAMNQELSSPRHVPATRAA